MTKKSAPEPMPEWMRDAIAAEPKGFMRDIVQASRQRSDSASMIPNQRQSQEAPRPPSGGTVEVKPPPGIDLIDRIAEAFAHNDRTAALNVKVEAQWLESQLRQAKGPLIESEYEPFDRENMEK